jgi:hypothetical protein
VDVRFDPFNMDEVQLWHKGKLEKVVKGAVIGEFNATQKAACDKVETAATSRVLEMYMKEQHKRFKKANGAFRLGEDSE